MRSIAIFLALMLPSGPLVAAVEQIAPTSLAPGEAVTLSLGADGHVAAPDRGRAQWSAFDLLAARQLVGTEAPDLPVPVGTPFSTSPDGPRPQPVPKGLVRLRLLSVADRQSLLVIENGLNEAFVYRAQVTKDGETRATDVCTVLPGQPSYEHWPFPIDRVLLSDFRSVAVRPGEPPVCE